MCKKRLCYFAYFVIVLFSLTFIWIKPSIHLNGENPIMLDVFTPYKEPGYSASFLGKDVSKNIIINSNIDSSKIGNYEVTYILDYKLFHDKQKRTVKVVDRVKPVITLKGQQKSYVCPNHSYEEEGYVAIDNYDLDITNKVIVEKKQNQITYTVSDKSSNKQYITRDIIYEDIVKPNLSLIGDNIITLYIGTTYEEPGYTAVDFCDGDITPNVIVSGNVDINTVGEYQLTYSVTDIAGNTSEVVRTIKVVKKAITPPPSMDGYGKTIYLTFDDGPSASITPSILQILKEENVKATFFVINHEDSLNYLIKREFEEGHTVALHSYTHDYSYVYSSINNYFEDLNSIQKKVENITGKKSVITRFPGGSSNTVSRKYKPGIMSELSTDVPAKGFIYFDWNVGSGDAGGAYSKEEVYKNVVNNLYYTNNVVLMHDFENNYKTLNALRDIIQYGKNHGYTFKAITETTPPVRHRVNN